MSFLNCLPSDCTQHILSHLELLDCLCFGSTCTRALRESLWVVSVKRDRMKQPYALITIIKKKVIDETPPLTCISPLSSTTSQQMNRRNYGLNVASTTKRETKVGRLDELRREHPEIEELVVFPTVQDRIEELASVIPAMHPLSETIRELCLSLRADVSTEPQPNRTSSLIELLRHTVRPLKLHAHILKTVLLFREAESTRTKAIHEYFGDVMCLAYLLFDNDPSQSYAEGTPSPSRLAEVIQQQFTTPSCYRCWILMHASILRTQQFSDREKARLGVKGHLLCGGMQSSNENKTSYNNATTVAHNMTLSSSYEEQMYYRNAWMWTMPMDCYRTEKFMSSQVVLVYDEFGPLGPSFRGRDIVRVRDITAHSMLSCFTSIRNDGWSRRDAIEWLCLVHEQALQTRPLSVRTPILRIT